MDDPFRLDGQIAIVTGASRGLGRAIALALAEAGADVAVAARNTAEIEDTAHAVEQRGRRALAIPTDVVEYAQVESLVARTVLALAMLCASASSHVWCMPRLLLAMRSMSKAPIRRSPPRS